MGRKAKMAMKNAKHPEDGEKRGATDALREEDPSSGKAAMAPTRLRPRPVLRESSQPGSSARAAATRPRAIGHQGARSRGDTTSCGFQ